VGIHNPKNVGCVASMHVQKPVKKIGLGGRVQLLSYNFIVNYVQGSTDISGTLSKPNCHIKKPFFKLIILPQIASAICRSRSKNNNSHSSKV